MPETIPSATIFTMLDTQWNATNVVKPTIVDINSNAHRGIRVEVRQSDHIIIYSEPVTLEEIPIGTWIYGHRISKILIVIYTAVNRQRLYDLMAEIRRVFHNQRHLLTGYQRIQFQTFNELVNENINQWEGRVICELINSAVLLEN